LEAGGDLNVVNDSNCTPLAYGSTSLLSQLNLMNGIATTTTTNSSNNINFKSEIKNN